MKKLFLAVLGLSFCIPSFALEVPERPSGYVNDYAGLLSASTRGNLELALADFEKNTTNQLVVATFTDLEGDTIEDFSIRLADKWKIGTSRNDNGILLVVSKNDRAIRIEVGYGLEGALPDALASRIIQEEILPAFREGDFDGGILRGSAAIVKATRGEYKPLPLNQTKLPVSPKILFFLLIFYFLLPIVCYAGIVAVCTMVWGLPGFMLGIAIVTILFILRKVFSQAQTFTGTPGGFLGGSRSGGYRSNGFGGFSGGGGGSFGGGGASGRW